MSTHYGFLCKECDKQSGTWVNHGQDLLRELCKVAPKINAILEDTDLEIELKIMGFFEGYQVPEALEFLKEHEGHDIALRNEYGDVEAL